MYTLRAFANSVLSAASLFFQSSSFPCTSLQCGDFQTGMNDDAVMNAEDNDENDGNADEDVDL